MWLHGEEDILTLGSGGGITLLRWAILNRMGSKSHALHIINTLQAAQATVNWMFILYCMCSNRNTHIVTCTVPPDVTPLCLVVLLLSTSVSSPSHPDFVFSFLSPLKISETIEDPYAYTQLTDSILQCIVMSVDSKLDKVGTNNHKMLIPVVNGCCYYFSSTG